MRRRGGFQTRPYNRAFAQTARPASVAGGARYSTHPEYDPFVGRNAKTAAQDRGSHDPRVSPAVFI
jgi:hypothetical protein